MNTYSTTLRQRPERRFQPRRRLDTAALYRESGRSKSLVHVTDLSPLGCRINCADAVIDGKRSWVTLPTLEPWACSVVWRNKVEFGLAFNRAFHPAVASMICNRLSPQAP